MKREILFRGKRIDNGDWVYGDLCKGLDGKHDCIMPTSFFATRDFGNEDEYENPIIEDCMAIGGFFVVDEVSVGQFTGLKDKNGKEAYFSDIVNAKIRDANGVVYDVIGIIGWGEFEIQLEMESDYWPVASWSLVESFEITGNIHQKL